MPEAASTSENQRHYAVFISYRHVDNMEAGRQWATWLHQALETYEIPRDLVGTKNNRNEPVPESLYPVFRDEEELSANAGLKESIYRALENTSLLVVICSPRAVESKYVRDEIRYFKELGKSSHILALMIDGEPNVSDGSGIAPERECLPEPLRFGVPRADGTVDWTARVEDPILADTRPEGKPAQGSTTGAAYRELLEQAGHFTTRDIDRKIREYEQRLELAKLKVIAGALGIELGVVTQRDKAWQLQLARTRARRLRKLVAGFAILALAAVIAGLVAIREKNAAVQTLSQSDFLQASRFIGENNRGDALAYLVRSIKENPKNEAAVTRLTTLLTYHSWMLPVHILQLSNKPVEWAEFSPDGRRIVSASDDHTTRIWDAKTGMPLATPLMSTDRVWHAEFSRDGGRIATASDDHTAKVWDADTGQMLAQVEHSNTVFWVAFSPDGTKIATASWDWTAQIWDARTGRALLKQPLQHSNILEYVQFSPDGRRIVTASDDGTAKVWDVGTGRMVAQLLHSNTVISAEFSPDGTRVVTASYDGTARIWDAQTGAELTPPLQHRKKIEWAEFSPDGKRVVTAAWDNAARIWDAQTGRPLTDSMKHNSAVYFARFSPDGKRIVTASLDSTARIWDAQTGEPMTEPLKHANFVVSAQFSPDGRQILTASYDGSAQVWDAQSGPALAEPLQEAGVLFSAFSPDGKRVVTTSDDHTAKVWDAATGRMITSVKHADTIFRAAFSPDAARIATASWDWTAQIWDARTGRALLKQPLQHSNILEYVQFSPDGKWIVTASDDCTAKVWDAETGRMVACLQHSHPVWSAQFSPDGTRIVTASGDSLDNGWVTVSTNGTAQVWDARTGAALFKQSIEHDAAVVVAQFSPDGKRIVTGSKDHTARVWDAQTGAPLTGALPHGNEVVSVQFSPNGRWILTASLDHTARVWDARTGQPLTEPFRQSGAITMAQFSRDSKWVVTTSRDGTAQLWDAQMAQALAEPLPHGGLLYSARFSPDGKRIVTVATNDMARIWDLAPSPTKYPDWLLPLAEAVSGESIDPEGVLALTTNRFETLQQIRQQLSRESTDDDWIAWGRWFLADVSTRAISPFSQMTTGDYIRVRIHQHTTASLDEAAQLAAGNTNLLRQISEARKTPANPD